MAYIYPIPVALVGAMIYIVSKRWELKIFAFISKIVIIVAVIFFLVTYASFLGYNIPFVSSFFNSLVK